MGRDREQGPSPRQSAGSAQDSDKRRIAPGKVTRTVRHAPAPGGAVQRKQATAAAGAARPTVKSAWEYTNDPWMDVAHRGGMSPGLAVQAKADAGGAEHTDHVHRAAAAGVSGSGSALPHLDRIQQSFGADHDVSAIQAHVGGAAATASEAMGASAYATGNSVAFRSAPDVHTAAHEAAHIIQQQQGVQLRGGVGEVGDAYERHADAVADRVVSGQSAEDLLGSGPGGGSQRSAVAMKPAVQRCADAPVQFYKNVTVNSSSALASEDDKIVKTGKRELYADPAHIETGNARLATVGAHGSYIHLDTGKTTIKHQGNTLSAVVPAWVDKGSDSGYHKKVNAPNSGGSDSEGDTSGDMALWTDCGRSSAAVTGSSGSDRQVVYDKGGKEVVADGTVDSSVKTYRGGGPNQMANTVYMDLMPGFIKNPANDKYLTANVHYTGSGATKVHKTPANIVEAKTMYDALTDPGKDAFDKQAGINHYANPEIGESYAMATEADMPGFKKMGPKTWNFHWGGVIMKGGSDNITLENFAVTSKYAKSKGVKQGEFIDRDWNFDIYGTVDKSQTFHHDHLDSNTHGNKATTITARTKGSAMRDWSTASWSSLSAFQKTHWTTLGWDETSWDNDTEPASESKDWSALSDGEREAATALGYNETSWNNS
ncbi:DUF4157 domain-containing protein [Haliangium sp.]|uniref:eCIS core domain-containing protein n=1 Tax=Haliangium sp. TaxID=2663208 RepID=UPI003D147AC0